MNKKPLTKFDVVGIVLLTNGLVAAAQLLAAAAWWVYA